MNETKPPVQPRHPALKRYSKGELVSIGLISDDGTEHRRSGKVIGVTRDGQTLVLEVFDHSGPKPGRVRIGLRATSIQRYLVREAAAENAKRAANAPKPTDKQIAYALALIDRLGPIGWHNSDAGQMRHAPDEAELRELKRHEISALIDSLRGELGHDDYDI